MKISFILYPFKIVLMMMVIIYLSINYAESCPLHIVDSSGKQLTLTETPSRVVSLVPSATEILFSMDCQDSIIGITHHDTTLKGAQLKKIIGGFFDPNLKKIIELRPDMLIVSPHHDDIMKYFDKTDCQYLVFDTRSLEESFDNIRMLGTIFNTVEKAEEIIKQNIEELDLIKKKVDMIPIKKRKRVMRLMGRVELMTPGDDSFQNEMIAAAGGIPPKLGKTGNIVPMSLEEWKFFNPQFIYGCGDDRILEKSLLKLPGWKEVDAIKNNQIGYFPCDLTCRASTNTGHFVSWLASAIYTEEFSGSQNCVNPEEVFETQPIDIQLSYIDNTHIAYSKIHDFINKSLIIRFKQPQSIISTLEGFKRHTNVVGNHYSSPPCWVLEHNLGLDGVRKSVYAALGLTEDGTSFLFTGADMDCLAVRSAQFREMKVYVIVTAGVEGNAMRMSRDEGQYYEPGTINMIILPNMTLTERAMTRAIISATEAKTAALWDMDIRSNYSPMTNPATGTGTDNIIVVKGTGPSIDNSGGHTKMGELIASVVYDGVKDAVKKQNKLISQRDIFKRLKERRLSVYSILSMADCECDLSNNKFAAVLEEILMDVRYSSFLKSAFSVSDDYERGLIGDLESFRQWCIVIAQEISGANLGKIENIVKNNDLPIVIRTSINAILTGVHARLISESTT